MGLETRADKRSSCSGSDFRGGPLMLLPPLQPPLASCPPPRWTLERVDWRGPIRTSGRADCVRICDPLSPEPGKVPVLPRNTHSTRAFRAGHPNARGMRAAAERPEYAGSAPLRRRPPLGSRGFQMPEAVAPLGRRQSHRPRAPARTQPGRAGDPSRSNERVPGVRRACACVTGRVRTAGSAGRTRRAPDVHRARRASACAVRGQNHREFRWRSAAGN